jgi:hypothetical protein
MKMRVFNFLEQISENRSQINSKLRPLVFYRQFHPSQVLSEPLISPSLVSGGRNRISELAHFSVLTLKDTNHTSKYCVGERRHCLVLLTCAFPVLPSCALPLSSHTTKSFVR